MVVVGGIAALGGIGYLLLSGKKGGNKNSSLGSTKKKPKTGKKKKQPSKVETIKLD